MLKAERYRELSRWWDINQGRYDRHPLRVLSLGVDLDSLKEWPSFETESLRFTGVDPRREVILASVIKSGAQWIESTFDEFTLYYDDPDHFEPGTPPNWEMIILEDVAVGNYNAIDFAFRHGILWVVVIQKRETAEANPIPFEVPKGDDFDEYLAASDDWDVQRGERVTVWERI